VRQLQEAHAKEDGIRALFGVSGSGTRLDANPTESGENIGKLSIVMAGGGSPELEAQLTEKLRGTMAKHPSAQVDFSRPELFSFSTPLEIELRGADLEAIQRAGQKMAALLRANPHYADVKSTVEQGFPEIQIRFDQERAASLGLTTRQIADAVVKKVRGEVATRYSFRDRKIDVLVRAQEDDRATVESIRRLIVNPGSGNPVTLESVADVVATTGPSEIHRSDQVRVAIVSANLRDIDLGTAVQEVQEMVARKPARRGRLDAHRRSGRGAGRIDRFAAVRVRAGGVPRLPGDGVAVRVAAAPVRDPVHHPAGAGRRRARAAADQLAGVGGGVHRPDPAGRPGDQERDHPDRQITDCP